MKKIIFTLALWLCLSSTAYAAELIMFSMKSCGYCRNFLKEVAQEYKNTDHAKVLPLRIISMDRKAAPRWFDKAYNSRKIDGIAGTPTFVVFDSGMEVARLIGYQGKDRFYDDIGRFIKENRDKLAARIGVNPLPYEKETEMTPEYALKETMGELANPASQHKEEGSHSTVPRQQSPFVPFLAPNMGAKDTNPHTKAEGKDEHGVFFSNDIMDHQYKTPEEAIRAAVDRFNCEGIHSHMIKGKKIWMPCKMQ